MELPAYLKSGEIARLIPVIGDVRKEQRAASVLLATLSAIPDFSNALLTPLGQRIGNKTTVNTFTETVFVSDGSEKDRPDGLIEIRARNRTWTALVEAKIGRGRLEKDQLERYLQLARNRSLDALITISNEFVARPTFHPVAVNKQKKGKIELFHISWASILTQAILMHENDTLTDPEQAFLLREFVRFLSHESVGVERFVSMPPEWNDVVATTKAGGQLKKTSKEVEAVVGGWHQEVRDLALLMSRMLGCAVEIKLTRTHANDPERRIADDVEALCADNTLKAELHIPDAASPLTVVANLSARTIRAEMTVDAPRDKKSTAARVRWLLNQIKDIDPADIVVELIWPTRAANDVVNLSCLVEDPAARNLESGVAPRAFTIALHRAPRRFSGRRNFVEHVEDIAPQFYELIGQRLRAWQAPPPKPQVKPVKEEPIKEPEPPKKQKPMAGNAHSSLLELPSFLKRIQS